MTTSTAKPLAGLLALILVPLALLAQTGPQLVEFDSLRTRMLREAVSYAGAEWTTVQTLRSKMNPDGSWKDKIANNWILEYRLLAMAQKYQIDPIYAGNPQLKRDTWKAIRYWLDNHNSMGKWINVEVYLPDKMAYVAIMMYDALEADIANGVTTQPNVTTLRDDIYDFISMANPDSVAPNRADIVLGANLAFRLYALTALAAMNNSLTKMDSVEDLLSQIFEINTGLGKQGFPGYPFVGMAPDGSWHQHNFDASQDNWTSYGGLFMKYTAEYGLYTKSTAWQIPFVKWRVLQEGSLEHYQWLYYRGQALYNVAGRSCLKPPGDYRLSGTTAAGYIQRMKDIGTYTLTRVPELNTAMYRLGDPTIPGLNGTRYFTNSDLMIYSRPDHYLGIKMLSERTMGPELGDGKNLKSYFMGDGSTFFFRTGNEYVNARVGWNLAAIPGTTLEQNTSGMPLRSSTLKGYIRSLNGFAGGVDDGLHGVSAFEYNRFHSYAKVKAQKSYFLFDNEFVFLGADIFKNGSPNKEIHTTLNQCEWVTPITYKINGGLVTVQTGTQQVQSWTNITNPIWFHQDSIGYLIIPDGPLTVKLWAQNRTGNWKTLDEVSSSASQTVPIFQLGINHGNNPSSAAYRYIVFPNVAASDMPGLISNLNVIVHQNDEDVQAVEHTGLKLTGAAFYEKNQQVVLQSGLRIKTDFPAVMLIDETVDSLIIRLTDPNHDRQQLEVKINEQVSGAGAVWDAGDGEATIAATMPAGLDIGTQVVLRLGRGPQIVSDLSPVITASADSGIAPTTLSFNAYKSSTVSTKLVGFEWDFGDGSKINGIAVQHIYSLPGTYTLTLTVRDDQNQFAKITKSIYIKVAPCLPIPGWVNLDIGNVQFAGDACQNQQTSEFSVTASGTDIWSKNDAFHFVYQKMIGDGEIIARVTKVEHIDDWTKGGVMMRSNLSPASANAMMYVAGDRKWSYQRRPADEMDTHSTKSTSDKIQYPHFVKIVRTGNDFKGYESADGSQWNLVDAETILMDQEIYVGLAVTAHDNTTSANATFDQIKITTTGTGGNGTGTFPIELLDFMATPMEDEIAVRLDWITASETNNDYFTVERSQDNQLFETVGFVSSKGNGTVAIEYDFVDPQPYLATSFYRLKQTDLNGDFSYTNSVVVALSYDNAQDDSYVKVFPSPASASSAVQVEYYLNDDAKFEIHDPMGRTIWSETLHSTDLQTRFLQIPAGTLPPGNYVAVIRNDVQSNFFRFVINP